MNDADFTKNLETITGVTRKRNEVSYIKDNDEYKNYEQSCYDEKKSLDQDKETEKKRQEAIATEYSLNLEDRKQNIALRKKASLAIFILVCIWMVMVLIFIGFIVFSSFAILPPDILGQIIHTILISTTAQVIALLAIVLHYLFPRHNK